MVARFIRPLCLCTWMVLLPADAGAQDTVAAGELRGTVVDRTGAPLAGVLVEISGERLMGVRSMLSEAPGSFRFPGLPPGPYSVVFSRAGFTTLRRDHVQVAIGFTATVDVDLDVAGIEDHVVVERDASVIDRRSTAIATAFTAQTLSDLPGSRSLFSVIAATPGVHVGRFEVGGGTGDTGSPYGAYGTTGANRPMIEGIVATNVFSSGFSLDYGSFEEVSVGTAAHDAQWPTPGVQMQVVTKSGGNTYRGTVYADYEPSSWQAFNIDDAQVALGASGGPGLAPRDANRVSQDYDVNVDVGGYIRKDRLWWYASLRDQRVAQRIVNLPDVAASTHAASYDGKVTWKLQRNHTLTVFGQAGRNHQPSRLEAFGPAGGSITPSTAYYASDLATVDQVVWGWVDKAEWNAILRNAAVVDVRVGEYGTTATQIPKDSAPRFEDIGTLIVQGGNRDWEERIRRPQLLASVAFTMPRPFGSHDMRLGGETLDTTRAEALGQAFPGDVLHVLRNGRPAEVYLFESPSTSISGLRIYGAYAADSWRATDRLTVNLGVRFDRYRAYLPEQTHPAGRFNPIAQTFPAVNDLLVRTTLAPRLGLAVDVSGHGTTIVKANYGMYWYPPGSEVGPTANPNAPQWWQRYAWTDLDGSGTWDRGEESRLVARRGGSTTESLDPDLHLRSMRELAAWLEHQLVPDTGLRLGFVWRAEGNLFTRQDASRPFDAFRIPVAIRDPGPDGSLGTDDDGPVIAGYDVDPDAVSGPPRNVVANVRGLSNRYWSLEVVATRRLVHRWSLTAGFEHTWTAAHASGFSGQAVRNDVLPVTPNDLINADDEGRYAFRTWSARVYGTFEGPWAIRVIPFVRHQSGQPYGRTFATTLSYGSVRVLAEPIDSRRSDNVTLADLRIEKGIRLSGRTRLDCILDVFNLLNANPVQTASWSSGTFERPLVIVAPRIARVGVRLTW